MSRRRSTATTRDRRQAQISRWLERRRREGWTWVDLSRRSGIPLSTLQWWKRRLESAGEPSSGQSCRISSVESVEKELAFVSAPLQSGAVSTTGSGRAQCLLELRSGHRLTIEEGFSAAALHELIAVLERT